MKLGIQEVRQPMSLMKISKKYLVFIILLNLLISCSTHISKHEIVYSEYKDYAGLFSILVPNNFEKRTSFDDLESVSFYSTDSSLFIEVIIVPFREDSISYNSELESFINYKESLSDITLFDISKLEVDSILNNYSFMTRMSLDTKNILSYSFFLQKEQCRNPFFITMVFDEESSDTFINKQLSKILNSLNCNNI